MKRIAALAGTISWGFLGGVGCGPEHASTSEPDGAQIATAHQAMTGAPNDVDTPEANVVVRIFEMAGFSCAGTFITPKVVLTAKHCLDGSSISPPAKKPIVIGIGPDPAHYQFVIGSTFTTFGDPGPLPDDGAGEDIGLVFVDDVQPASVPAPVGLKGPITPIARTKLLDLLHIRHPDFGQPFPSGGSTDTYGGGLVGFASNSDGTHTVFRQAVIWNSVTLHHSTGYHGAIWYRADGSGGVSFVAGDSGSPIFEKYGDNTRVPFAVHSGTQSVSLFDCEELVGGTCDIWSDFVGDDGSSLGAYVAAGIKDNSRSASWIAFHGWITSAGILQKTLDDGEILGPPEIGEVDYTGPCQQSKDTDCDHWFDQHDYCPVFFNPDQLENDPCRKCPKQNAADADPDNDGICNGDGDNCPSVFNPKQENCNAEAEQASIARGNSTSVLGDACDPVPCPLAELPERTQVGGNPFGMPSCGGNAVFGLSCSGRTIRDQLHLMPIGSSPASRTSSGSTPASLVVAGVPTDYRFCQYGLAQGIDCRSPAVLQDSQLNNGSSSATEQKMSASFPWHRISVGGHGRDDTPERFDYGNTDVTRTWAYQSDNSFWLMNNMLPPVQNYANCTNGAYGGGTCLEGRLWVHGETPIGTSSGTMLNGTAVGVHGFDLANTYTDAIPDEATNWFIPGVPDSPAVNPIMIAKTLPDPPPNVEPIWGSVINERIAVPVLSTLAGDQVAKPVGIIGHAGYPVSWAISPHLAQTLTGTGTKWIAAAEPGSALGRAAALPDAVMPALDATSVVDVAYFTKNGAVAGSEIEGGSVFAQASSAPHPSARQGFATVYSKVDGGVFIVGGTDRTTGATLGDLWFLPAGGTFTKIPLHGYSFTTVLAATYSFADKHLWVLDRAPTGPLGAQEVHLVSVDPTSGAASLIGKWGWLGLFDTDFIVVDRDGSLILASSYGGLGAAYYVGRITMVQGQPTASVLAANPGRLLAPPIIDDHGYEFLVRALDGSVSTVRLGKPSWVACALSALSQLF